MIDKIRGINMKLEFVRENGIKFNIKTSQKDKDKGDNYSATVIFKDRTFERCQVYGLKTEWTYSDIMFLREIANFIESTSEIIAKEKREKL